MADLPPYMNAYGNITSVLEKIKSAPTPPKFTQDFLQTKLGIQSSSARPIIPFLKKMGFIDDANVPTDRYRRFRNPPQSGKAAAEGLRSAYKVLFDSNEYAHDLQLQDLEGLVIQITGLDKSNQSLRAIVSSFNALKSFANHDESAEHSIHPDKLPVAAFPKTIEQSDDDRISSIDSRLNISYTINLNLPETTDVEVFDAIFQSLNRNILKSDE